MNKPKYMETRRLLFREGNGGRVPVSAIALRLFDYRDYCFIGVCAGMVFISQEPFTGSKRIYFAPNNGSLNLVLISSAICKEAGIKETSECELYESNGDIFFKPIAEPRDSKTAIKKATKTTKPIDSNN